MIIFYVFEGANKNINFRINDFIEMLYEYIITLLGDLNDSEMLIYYCHPFKKINLTGEFTSLS